eukprot:TRINITY_DN34362_c0_g1_i3.p1 TRINITY_DN34362_c0_g1~~TRINITY_DN34362_c0_g1_i3.p1  ORF type:complete len:126 (+),score=25.65 TRINITY_DN34362_c0_g1_i3:223-600(+)
MEGAAPVADLLAGTDGGTEGITLIEALCLGVRDPETKLDLRPIDTEGFWMDRTTSCSIVSFSLAMKKSKTLANVLAVSYTHLRAHETPEHLVCRLLLEKKKMNTFLPPLTVPLQLYLYTPPLSVF